MEAPGLWVISWIPAWVREDNSRKPVVRQSNGRRIGLRGINPYLAKGPKAQNKLGSIRKKHKALVSLFSVANIKGAKHDHTMWSAFEQVYVLSGMNECLTDPLLPAGNGHFHIMGGLATAVSIRSLGNGLNGSIQRLVKVKIHGPYGIVVEGCYNNSNKRAWAHAQSLAQAVHE